MSRQQKESFTLIICIVITVIVGVVSTRFMAKTQKNISDGIIKVLREQKDVSSISKLVLLAQYRKQQLRTLYDDMTIYRDPNYVSLYIQPIRRAGDLLNAKNFDPTYQGLIAKIKTYVSTFTSGAKISALNDVVSKQFTNKINKTMENIENDLKRLKRIQDDIVERKTVEADKSSRNIDGLFLGILSAVILVSILMGVRLRKQTKKDIAKRLSMADTEFQQKLAKDIRASLFPSGSDLYSDLYDVAAYMDTPGQIGGDYYDFIVKGDYTWFPIGDTTGHDMEAAMFALSLKFATELTIEQSNNMTPYEFLEELNRRVNNVKNKMARKTPELSKKSATFLIVKMDNNGKCEYAGSHTDLLLYRGNSKKVEIVKSNDCALEIGQINNKMYSVMIDKNKKQNSVKLNQGDKIVLYTDGILEAKIGDDYINENGVEIYNGLGVDGLVNLIKTHGHKSSNDLIDSIKNDISGYGFEDDLTIMAIGRK